MDIAMRYAIEGIVHTFRGFVHGKKDEGLWLRISTVYQHFANEREYRSGNGKVWMDFIFRFPFSQHGSVNTFYKEHDGYVAPWDIDWPSFENISNHDSCWINSVESKLHDLHMRSAEDVIRQVEKKYGYFVPDPDSRPTRVMMRPCDVGWHNYIQDISHVQLQVERIHHKESWREDYQIKSVKNLKDFR